VAVDELWEGISRGCDTNGIVALELEEELLLRCGTVGVAVSDPEGEVVRVFSTTSLVVLEIEGKLVWGRATGLTALTDAAPPSVQASRRGERDGLPRGESDAPRRQSGGTRSCELEERDALVSEVRVSWRCGESVLPLGEADVGLLPRSRAVSRCNVCCSASKSSRVT